MFGYCLVIYLNSKNKTLFRLNGSPPRYKIGETTSMGWLVVDKQYYSEKLKMFVGEKTMMKLSEESQEEYYKKRRKKDKKKKIFKTIYQIFK